MAGRPEETGEHCFFRLKALRSNLRPALDLARKLLTEADFRDTGRLRDIVQELRNDQQASFIPAGHQYAALRAASRLSSAARREETWKGTTQLLALHELCGGLEGRLADLGASLETIRRRVIRTGGLTLNVTASREAFAEARGAVSALVDSLPSGEAGDGAPRGPRPRPDRSPRAESLVTSTAVGYVARAVEGFRFEEERSAPQAVLGHLLSTGYLWESVRMEGGAYGASAHARSMDGVFLFTSSRDPHIVRTIRAFREALERTAERGVDARELDRAVIGVVSRDERPIDPGEKGFVALQRRLYGVTDTLRQARRSQVLGIRGADVQGTARSLLAAFDGGVTVVLSSKTAVDEAAREMAELAAHVREIPE
jgi:Zn-dependent M16 (insulinase) family peptidase